MSLICPKIYHHIVDVIIPKRTQGLVLCPMPHSLSILTPQIYDNNIAFALSFFYILMQSFHCIK